jgi:hypothetical protein
LAGADDEVVVVVVLSPLAIRSGTAIARLDALTGHVRDRSAIRERSMSVGGPTRPRSTYAPLRAELRLEQTLTRRLLRSTDTIPTYTPTTPTGSSLR